MVLNFGTECDGCDGGDLLQLCVQLLPLLLLHLQPDRHLLQLRLHLHTHTHKHTVYLLTTQIIYRLVIVIDVLVLSDLSELLAAALTERGLLQLFLQLSLQQHQLLLQLRQQTESLKC